MPGRGAGRSGGGRVQVLELPPTRARSLGPTHRRGLGAKKGSRPQPPRLALQRAPGAPALPPAKPGRSARSRLQGSGIRGRRL